MSLMAIAAGIYLWNYPLNKGVLTITANLQNYLIFSGGKTTECIQNKCEITVKPGIQEIKIQQDGYFPETIKVKIKRGKNKGIESNLQKIPKLTVSKIIPASTIEEKVIPKELENIKILISSWNKTSDQLAFIDEADLKLKIWKEGSVKTITLLKDASADLNLEWSDDNRNIFGQQEKVIYFINIEKASRKKGILNFNPKNIVWIPGKNDLLVNNDNLNVYRISFDTKEEEKMDLVLNLKNITWEKEDHLIFYDDDKESNRTLISDLNIETLERTEILTKFNFPINQIETESGKIFFHHEIEERWYELDY